MQKINLVIVDEEKDYLEAIGNYIISNYSKRFKVSTFSDIEYLNRFLSQHDKDIDVILINENMHDKSNFVVNVKTCIFLCEGKPIKTNEVCNTINKYQPADDIIKKIIKIISETNEKEYFIPFGDKKTKVVAVYSPVGGAGKTSICVGASIVYSNCGKDVFYLNLEPFPSTPLFFNCNNRENFSNTLYYSKNKEKNLLLKVEGSISRDSQSKVNYFTPPESVLDVNESTPDEICEVIKTLRVLNKYNYIFIDMCSNLNDKNISILQDADVILLVITPDELSMIKSKHLHRDLEILSKRLGDSLIDKSKVVINKCKSDTIWDLEGLSLWESQILIKIPKVSKIFSKYDVNYCLDFDSEFITSLKELRDTI